MRSNIEAERGRAGMSKAALCRELEITAKTYNRYINGGAIPSSKLLCMANLFDCSIDYLLDITEKRNKKVEE